MATISEALAMGVEHHRAGRFQSAEQIYRQILQVAPQPLAAKVTQQLHVLRRTLTLESG